MRWHASTLYRTLTHSLARSLDRQSFDFWKDPEDPVFHFYEVYESDTAFTEYYNSGEMRDFLQKVEPLAASDIGMTYVRLRAWLFCRVHGSLTHSLCPFLC